ncbi:MAG: secretin N-terminal domain-containing protein [Alphaproteobacteria bacterium]|nr:secretin N-terminal domain-containing protein [Alphaproteobacteria bacterium]
MPKKGETSDVIDRQQNLTVDDFRNLNAIDREKNKKDTAPTATAALGAPPIPDVAEVLAVPRPPKVANTKLVTLSVTDDVPLRDVLFELGRLANVDIEVGPGLDTTGINLRATNRPFNEVIGRISALAHLRYSVSGNALRVERDLPYIKNYSLDFLNIVRSSSSGYNITTSILSGDDSSGSSGSSSTTTSGSGGVTGGNVGTSGSTSSINSTGESDMWSALEASVKEIVAYNPAGDEPGGGAAPGATATSAAPAAAGGGTVVINRQAGILSVNATAAQHEMIAHFLSLMSRNASAQVLIEAKIVEVTLADQFLSGVDWNQVVGGIVDPNYLKLGSYTASISNGPNLVSGSAAAPNSVAFGLKSGDGLDAVLRATQRFGTTRTLSSPRLSATNNQQAVLTFARNEVFFDCTTTPSTTIPGGSAGNTTIDASTTCTANSVPIGIILNIMPAINLDSQEVTLSVRPTLTRVVGSAVNPATPTSTLPVIEVRELDSVMKVSSGGVMVIGGLMEDATRNVTDGVPGLGEVPIFGNLFKSRSEDSSKRELIIFIKATIVNPDGSSHLTDRKVYEKFVSDPRPLYNK